MISAIRRDHLKRVDLWLNAALLLVTAAVLLAAHLAAIAPLQARFRDVATETAEHRRIVGNASDIAQVNQTLRARLSTIQKKAAALQQRIPTSSRESDFLGQIGQLAEQTGVEIADYLPGNVQIRESHQEMEIKVSARGEYSAIAQFLEQVDRLPRLCRLTQMEIGVNETNGRLHVELAFHIYFAPPVDPDAAKGRTT